MITSNQPKVSAITDPALERLVRIYYFLHDGKQLKDKSVLSRKDYCRMQSLLEESFPGKFSKQDVTFYTEKTLSKTFNNVYNSYDKKYGYLKKL